ncbi:MAG: NADP-dependent oxidoreductase [Candidatus Eremiobacteraeota bacterium]|nr:NADP-dependent oxidoreductase [Candidatus Eremiobacteraeota bacterium]
MKSLPSHNRRVLLASRPKGEPTADNFKLDEVPVRALQTGEVLLRTIYLSLDPYMRGRMSDAKSYAAPVEVGGVMVGGTVGEVVASEADGFAVGDLVQAYSGWQEYEISNGTGLRKIDRSAPISTAVGVLGMPGMTAYTGLLEIGKPKPGETVVVAAATGPVGSLVGQIAKLKGCTVVGVAGGAEKCAYAERELGFDACIDHRAPDFPARLRAAVPAGIDVYFENVGGAVREAVIPLLNPFSRVPVFGLIAWYNATSFPGDDKLPMLMRTVLSNRVTIRGFIVSDFAALHGAFQRDVGKWLSDGRIVYREDIVEGLERAPAAFIGLLRGENFGKLVVRVSPD